MYIDRCMWSATLAGPATTIPMPRFSLGQAGFLKILIIYNGCSTCLLCYKKKKNLCKMRLSLQARTSYRDNNETPTGNNDLHCAILFWELKHANWTVS